MSECVWLASSVGSNDMPVLCQDKLICTQLVLEFVLLRKNNFEDVHCIVRTTLLRHVVLPDKVHDTALNLAAKKVDVDS